MAIHSSGTFSYQAEVTVSFNKTELMLNGRDSRDGQMKSLVGPYPKIRFWHDRLVLIASDQANASMRNASFVVGDAVRVAAQVGDQLYVVRTGAGGIGLSLLRSQKLVLGLGVVTALPLGNNFEIKNFDLVSERTAFSEAPRGLKLTTNNEELVLLERKTASIGGYYVYVENCPIAGIPGTDECVALCVGENAELKVAAMRSAILIGNADIKFTKWDTTEISWSNS